MFVYNFTVKMLVKITFVIMIIILFLIEVLRDILRWFQQNSFFNLFFDQVILIFTSLKVFFYLSVIVSIYH